MTLPDHTPKDPQEDPDYDPFASSEKELVKRAKYYEAIMRMFWKRWRNEYLTGLREQDRKRNTNHQTPVSRGDVILIHDDLPRSILFPSYLMVEMTYYLTGRMGFEARK